MNGAVTFGNMYNENSSGSRPEPCGTPQLTWKDSREGVQTGIYSVIELNKFKTVLVYVMNLSCFINFGHNDFGKHDKIIFCFIFISCTPNPCCNVQHNDINFLVQHQFAHEGNADVLGPIHPHVHLRLL